MADRSPSPPPESQPAFNLPGVVAGLVAFLVLIHLGREFLLSAEADFRFVLTFAFIPARVTEPSSLEGVVPGGDAARVWSFLTYAFLHANWAHIGVNCLWLVAFGSPLARRFGPTRFLLFSAIGAIGGAALQLAIHPASVMPMVGASAAISAEMAGASRFVFSAGGPLRGFQARSDEDYREPAPPLREVIRDRRVIIFLAVWFGLNLIFGIWAPGGGLSAGPVAWEAHIGGFLAGLLLFSLFDPVPRRRPAGKD